MDSGLLCGNINSSTVYSTMRWVQPPQFMSMSKLLLFSSLPPSVPAYSQLYYVQRKFCLSGDIRQEVICQATKSSWLGIPAHSIDRTIEWVSCYAMECTSTVYSTLYIWLVISTLTTTRPLLCPLPCITVLRIYSVLCQSTMIVVNKSCDRKIDSGSAGVQQS